jgi:hypothetical protein
VRHDPPRIVYAGRVWRGTMEVPMPTFTPLPADIAVGSYLDAQGRVAVSVYLDHAEVARLVSPQTVDELRAERERIARSTQEGER